MEDFESSLRFVKENISAKVLKMVQKLYDYTTNIKFHQLLQFYKFCDLETKGYSFKNKTVIMDNLDYR